MNQPGLPTFDQLRIFLAVVDAGGFAGAARRLNRAVSVVSYAIDNLEAQLGLPLFERRGARRPELTEAGKAILTEACAVARSMDNLRARALGLTEGLEAELDFVVDVMAPTLPLVAALRSFAEAFPTVALRLHVEALGAVAQMVRDRAAAIGLSGPLAEDFPDLTKQAAGAVEMVPVAAPAHPLACLDPAPPGAARDHVQLVLTDRSQATQGRDFSVLSPRTWRLADLGVKHALLRSGVGWGTMPEPMVAEDLRSGALLRLRLAEPAGGLYRFSLVWRADAPPGPAARWLVDHFSAACDAARPPRQTSE